MEHPLTPEPALLCKVGSIVSHAEEMLSPQGHQLDRMALEALLADPEVVAWMAAMRGMALVPEPRARPVDNAPSDPS